MIGCVLLAGGKSSRMNGIDKALVRINNKTLLQLILDKLKIDKSRISKTKSGVYYYRVECNKNTI